MHRQGSVLLRVLLVSTAAATTAACISNRDVTGSVAERAELAARVQYPVSYREINPPASPVEIRAQCWMLHEKDSDDLDTRTRLVRKCVSERTGLFFAP